MERKDGQTGTPSANWYSHDIKDSKFKIADKHCIASGKCSVQFVERVDNSGDSYQEGFIIGIDKESHNVCFVAKITEGTREYFEQALSSVEREGKDEDGEHKALKSFVEIYHNSCPDKN